MSSLDDILDSMDTGKHRKKAEAFRLALAELQRELVDIDTAPMSAAGLRLAADSIRRCRALVSAALRKTP